jgi:hypothetical protein
MRAIGVVLLVWAVGGWAEAGELLFRNGKQLPAELAGQVLLVSTGSDVVEVPTEQVAVMTADEIRLKDGRVIRGAVVGGSVRARTEYGELAVRLEEVRHFRAVEERPQPPAPPVVAAAPPVATPAPPAVAPSPPGATPGPTAGAAAPTATPSGGPAQVSEGASRVGQGVGQTARGVGQTVSDGADMIHDGFKAFGLAVWDGMKAIGRAIEEAVTGR